ncbi:hypothetical protein BBJ28_00011689 [Nothophytophthora sp. Chile5]|nr:hypothetical protein BBJ28_00011689 [Nothophytophthora sp. Chile5]
MKRRPVSKARSNGLLPSRSQPSWRGDSASDSSVKIRDAAKKVAKKRSVGNPRASSCSLRKKQPDPSRSDDIQCGSDAVSHAAECQRLREQLERVLADHQRQEEEIVALRALARSLKEEVETIHERQHRQGFANSDFATIRGGVGSRSHEFFKLDVQVEQLQGENAELRNRVLISQQESKRARDCIAQQVPAYKLAAVKAHAELRCVNSQLQQERAHSDRLREQLVRCKARHDDLPVRVASERGNNNQQQEDDDGQHERARMRQKREDFLLQCLRLQENEPSSSHKKKVKEAEQREVASATETGEATRWAAPSLQSSSNSVSSRTPLLSAYSCTPSTELLHEDLAELNNELHKLSLSLHELPSQSKRIQEDM